MLIYLFAASLLPAGCHPGRPPRHPHHPPPPRHAAAALQENTDLKYLLSDIASNLVGVAQSRAPGRIISQVPGAVAEFPMYEKPCNRRVNACPSLGQASFSIANEERGKS
jgi:hypothetical protein